MILAGLIAWFFSVSAERKPLETVMRPLSFLDRTTTKCGVCELSGRQGSIPHGDGSFGGLTRCFWGHRFASNLQESDYWTGRES
jgi:hypothetical protein